MSSASRLPWPPVCPLPNTYTHLRSACVWSFLLAPVSSRCPSGCAVRNRPASLAAWCTIKRSSRLANMGKNAHVRVPIYQQQAMRVAAKQLVNEVSSPPASSPSEFVPAACAEFPATLPAKSQPLFDISLKYPTAQHASTSQVGTWTWPESYPRSHLPPTCTWAPPPERKCNGQGGGDHACAPAIDLATLLQLTAWIERLDAIMRMHDGEDEVILKIRTRAVGVLDSWVQRWEV